MSETAALSYPTGQARFDRAFEARWSGMMDAAEASVAADPEVLAERAGQLAALRSAAADMRGLAVAGIDCSETWEEAAAEFVAQASVCRAPWLVEIVGTADARRECEEDARSAYLEDCPRMGGYYDHDTGRSDDGSYSERDHERADEEAARAGRAWVRKRQAAFLAAFDAAGIVGPGALARLKADESLNRRDIYAAILAADDAERAVSCFAPHTERLAAIRAHDRAMAAIQRRRDLWSSAIAAATLLAMEAP